MMNGKIMEPHMKIMSLLLVVCVCVWEHIISTENVSLHKRQEDYDAVGYMWRAI